MALADSAALQTEVHHPAEDLAEAAAPSAAGDRQEAGNNKKDLI